MQVNSGFITALNAKKKVIKADAYSRLSKELAIAQKSKIVWLDGSYLEWLCEAEQRTVKVSGVPILQHPSNDIVQLFAKR